MAVTPGPGRFPLAVLPTPLVPAPRQVSRGGATAMSAAGFHWAAGELAGQLAAARRVLDMAAACAHQLGTVKPASDDAEFADGRGPGHGIPSPEGRRAADRALRTAGLVLDPVYTAKALAALPEVLGATITDPDLTTVFWHTGGLLDAVNEWEN